MIPVTADTILVLAGVTRDELGRQLRDYWEGWATEQADLADHPDWTVPWDQLPERVRQVDTLMAVHLFCAGWLAGHAGRAAQP